MLPTLEVPAEDRNRTSPFPYGGHRFEFRAVGSSQNVSLVNTVLQTIVADAFKCFADQIEAGAAPQAVASKALEESWKVVFNGNNYDAANQQMLTDRGVWRIDSGVEAICRLTDPKNIKLFTDSAPLAQRRPQGGGPEPRRPSLPAVSRSSLPANADPPLACPTVCAAKVMDEPELMARQLVQLTHYTGTVEIEAKCMVDMINQQIIPACKESGVGSVPELQAVVKAVEAGLAAVHHGADELAMAQAARVLRLETMTEGRKVVDAIEALVPANKWPLATYARRRRRATAARDTKPPRAPVCPPRCPALAALRRPARARLLQVHGPALPRPDGRRHDQRARPALPVAAPTAPGRHS